MKFDVRCRGERNHAIEQLLAGNIGTWQRRIDLDSPEPQPLVAAQRNPSEFIIDTISRHKSQDMLVQGIRI